MDISPKTKQGIVDINIHEESHVGEILHELIQRFGSKEDSDELKNFLVKRIEEKVESNAISFYEYDYTTSHQIDVSAKYGLSRLYGNEVWLSESQPKLHVYS